MNTITIVVTFAAVMMLCERLWPGGKQPQSPYWWTRTLILNGAQALIAYAGASLWDQWFSKAPLFQAPDHLLGSALLGYLVITFVYYWWHRARHEVGFLWNWFHQVHHSPNRIEVMTSFYKHPLEILVNGLLSSFIVYYLLGLSPEAAALCIMFTGVAELFYHWNIKTPHWLGYVIQRPESHRLHHQTGLHRYNYSDLPLWDWMFGTFNNPKNRPEAVGFINERECQIRNLLLGRNVNMESGS